MRDEMKQEYEGGVDGPQCDPGPPGIVVPGPMGLVGPAGRDGDASLRAAGREIVFGASVGIAANLVASFAFGTGLDTKFLIPAAIAIIIGWTMARDR